MLTKKSINPGRAASTFALAFLWSSGTQSARLGPSKLKSNVRASIAGSPKSGNANIFGQVSLALCVKNHRALTLIASFPLG